MEPCGWSDRRYRHSAAAAARQLGANQIFVDAAAAALAGGAGVVVAVGGKPRGRADQP